MSVNCVSELSRETLIKYAGLYSFFGSVVLLVVAAMASGKVPEVVQDFAVFMGGNALAERNTGSIAEFVSSLPTLLLLDLILSFGTILVIQSLQRKVENEGKHRVSTMLQNLAITPVSYRRFVFLIFCEEVGGRWLFLGLIPSLLAPHSSVLFYTLLIMGSAAFAGLHILNYEQRTTRTVVLVLPQFVSSFLLGYVFNKYGLAAALVLHLGADALLFCMHKNTGLARNFILHIVGRSALLILCLMEGLNFSQVILAFDPSSGVIKSASIEQATLFLVFVSASVSLLLTFLCYDQSPSAAIARKQKRLKWSDVLFMSPVVAIVIWLFANVLFHSFNFVAESPASILLFITVLSVGSWQCGSGSSLAYAFWASITGVYLLISIAVLMPVVPALVSMTLVIWTELFFGLLAGKWTMSIQQADS